MKHGVVRLWSFVSSVVEKNYSLLLQ